MKYIICGIVIILSVAHLLIFLNLKEYLRKHENETVEKMKKNYCCGSL